MQELTEDAVLISFAKSKTKQRPKEFLQIRETFPPSLNFRRDPALRYLVGGKTVADGKKIQAANNTPCAGKEQFIFYPLR